MNNMNFDFQKLDYSNPTDATTVLNRLGGEDLLRKKYPAVYQSFLRTREQHFEIRNNMCGGMTNQGFQSGVKAETIALGYSQKGAVNSLSDNSAIDTLSASVWAKSSTEWTDVTATGWMKNTTQNLTLDSFQYDYENTNSIEEYVQANVQDIYAVDNQELESHIHLDALMTNGLMESLNSDTNSGCIVEGGVSTVKYIEITAPYSKSNDPIIMLYDRSPATGETSDYSYPENKANADRTVNTIMPLSGSITFQDKYELLGLDIITHSNSPRLLYDNKGIVICNHTQEQLASFFPKPTGQTATFNIEKNWNALLNVTAYTEQNIADVGVSYSFFYTLKNRATKRINYTPITIRSTRERPRGGYYKVENNTTVLIPMVKIRWGCFAKDTSICMDDGSEKIISQIKHGDRVMTLNGNAVDVRDIISGHESYIVNIDTVDHRTLKVTPTHPIDTINGLMPANKLRTGDILKLAQGGFTVVKHVYQINYDDKVFNLDTGHEGHMLYANGLVAGDFVVQNEYKYPLDKKQNSLPPEVIEISNQMKELLYNRRMASGK